MIAGLAPTASAQTPAVSSRPALFPKPFVVEHKLIQTDATGDVFATEPVTDYYDGSRIVSVRPNGSRLVVDFTERRLTEVRPDKQTFSVLSFDRFAELSGRLAHLESKASPPPMRRVVEKTTPPSFVFEEVPGSRAKSGTLASRRGVRHLRVRLAEKAGEAPSVEVWLDPDLRLRDAAAEALERFEDEVLGGQRAQGVPWSKYVSAARRHGGHAFPIRIRRPLTSAPQAAAAGSVEDVASRLETGVKVPPELLTLPDSYRRVPHPLEQMVLYAEQEAELAQRMSLRTETATEK
jgi:hypothetical protein